MSKQKVCRVCGEIVTHNSKSDRTICNRCKKKKWPPSAEAKARSNKKSSQRKEIRERPYLIHRKDKCECCGFIPIHICQLAVDHVDGNHANNEPSNLQTLCHNCHTLKSYVNRDWETKNINSASMQISFTF